MEPPLKKRYSAKKNTSQGFFQNEANVRFVLQFIQSPYDLFAFRRVSKLFDSVITDQILPKTSQSICGFQLDNKALVEYLKNKPIRLSDFSIQVTYDGRPDLTMKINYDNKLSKCEQLFTLPNVSAPKFVKNLKNFNGKVHFNIFLSHKRRKYLRKAEASFFMLANYDLVLDSPHYFCETENCLGNCKKTTFRLSHLEEDEQFAFYLFSEGSLWKKNQVLHRLKMMFGVK